MKPPYWNLTIIVREKNIGKQDGLCYGNRIAINEKLKTSIMLLKHKNEISGATLQSIYTLINTIMNRALKLKIIKDNPCKYVERPKRDKFTPDTLTIEEIQKY